MICSRLISIALAASAAHGSADAAAGCPPNFAKFVARFSTDIAFQKRHTASEIVESHVSQPTEPTADFKTVEQKTRSSQLKFPLMPTPQERQKFGLVIDIEHAAAKRPVAIVRTPDAGSYQVRFTFRKDSCWSLIRRDDEAI